MNKIAPTASNPPGTRIGVLISDYSGPSSTMSQTTAVMRKTAEPITGSGP
jgi:hypothetical protein